jgi:hypothetical protein
MAAAVKVLYEKRGVNFKTTVFGITLSGNYPGDPGEVVTLTASSASNPGAVTCDGPNGNAPIGAVVSSSQLGGYKAEVKPTATPGQYDLSFWFGGSGSANPQELAAGAYPAGISGGLLTVAVDYNLQGV